MPARLHRDLLVTGAPDALVVFTHGIFGSGANWRTIARAVIARRPTWGAVLVDLRQHGRSQAGPPPHTVAACAADLAALVDELGRTGPPVGAAVGHSFGGKVVLATPGLAARFILDSTPGPRPSAWDDPSNTVHAAYASMLALGGADRLWPRREDYAVALVARGHDRAIASWLAMNLIPADGGLRLRLDLEAIRALVLDYFATDLWSAVDDPAAGPLHFLIAGRGNTVSAADVERLRRAPAHVTATVLPDAHHWLNVDAADDVVAHVADRLP